MAENLKPVLTIGGAALVGWYLWTQGYLYNWFGILPPGVTPSTPGNTPAVASTTSGGTQTPVMATPVQTTAPTPAQTPAPTPTPAPSATPAATFAIVGAVTPNINNSLTANVSINGGTAQNITIIQSSAQAYDTSGTNITAALTAKGVNVPALLAAMQAAYHPAAGSAGGTAGLGRFVPIAMIHGGPQMVFRRPR